MEIKKIKISQIEFDDNQPRKDIVNVGELSNSINKEGLMTPIELLDLGNDKYKVIDGERRLRACILLKYEEIDAIIKNKIKNVFIRQLISDFHKEKLNLNEQAEAVNKLENDGLNLEEIRLLLGIGKTKFQLLKKVLRFNPDTKRLITEGKLTTNIINNISFNDLDAGKENEIIKEIIDKKAKSKYQISKIILERSNVRYIVNKYLTDSYVFEKKTSDFNDKLMQQKRLIEDTIRITIKSNDNSLEQEIRLVKGRLESILQSIEQRKTKGG